ncbi:Smr/MutS family protein [Novosphingobium colocasiae]|uniref:Smr protein/Muts2-like n=1 Tax=Novosphingobium colocasiae TaxID=1256513 RepID=A0A918PK06_9SPHN|nr:Smr/MutS family protein [Novosphingobium colocasiae]GGZ12178.1 smr protein/Muts2-like [Novosphingobium colocasiae]
MRRPQRGLSDEDARHWAALARTVTPLHPRKPAPRPSPQPPAPAPIDAPVPVRKVKGRVPPPLPPRPVATPQSDAPLHLDGSWEKRIAKGTLAPDFSLDLHGHGLDAAYQRLIHGLTQAKAMGARVVLVVAGKPRDADAMDRGNQRGAIRAKIADWLHASDHGPDIVALRGAHRRHGGPGALYVILRKRR